MGITAEKSHTAVSRNPLLEGSEGLPAQLCNRINTHPVRRDTSVKHPVIFNTNSKQRKMDWMKCCL